MADNNSKHNKNIEARTTQALPTIFDLDIHCQRQQQLQVLRWSLPLALDQELKAKVIERQGNLDR